MVKKYVKVSDHARECHRCRRVLPPEAYRPRGQICEECREKPLPRRVRDRRKAKVCVRCNLLKGPDEFRSPKRTCEDCIQKGVGYSKRKYYENRTGTEPTAYQNNAPNGTRKALREFAALKGQEWWTIEECNKHAPQFKRKALLDSAQTLSYNGELEKDYVQPEGFGRPTVQFRLKQYALDKAWRAAFFCQPVETSGEAMSWGPYQLMEGCQGYLDECERLREMWG